MACQHRFLDDLFPVWEIDYLFVGTFNPEWTKSSKNNAEYFYGRHTNDFWYIMPQVFNHNSLMDKQYRRNKAYLTEFTRKNRIGITDLISVLSDAEIENNIHKQKIYSFKDTDLEQFNFIPTNIFEIIEKNRKTLRGIFFTRHIDDKCMKISELWRKVKDDAQSFGIKTDMLVTPSRGYRRINRDQKLQLWKEKI